MYDDLVGDLRSRVAAGDVVVVAGAGVAMAATAGAPAASWLGLLRAGIDHVVANVPGVSEAWPRVMEDTLGLGDLDSLLSVASQVTSRLGGREGGEYARFLVESVGGLELVDPRVPAALASWGVPLATTNYDGLIEAASGWDWATWRDVSRLQRVLLQRERVVAHLHGFWDDAASVVLGIRSYDDLLGAPGVQGLQQAFMATRTLVFVGMGAGADDPNWAALRRWAVKAFPSQQHRHYRLCTTGEIEDLARAHEGERIVPLPYGDHADLAAFLEDLAPPRTARRTAAPPRPDAGLPAKRRTFGREAEIANLVAVVLDEDAGPGLVLGPPGVGKTNLTLAVLHSPVVVEAFGPRRFWLRCDAITDPAELPGELAVALGAPVSAGNPMAKVSALLAEAPSLLVLDNAETPWEAGPVATEAFLEALAALPGVRLVASLRGTERPGGPAWAPPMRLAPLAGAAARELFVSIAGERFATERLDEFLEEMGGLPLAIELLAYVAETEDDLDALIGRWREGRMDLARAGGLDKSLNLAASFEVSWSSPLLTDPARRLLSLLGALPDGIAHADLDALLPDEGHTAAAVAKQRALAFDEKGRLRTHPPLRHHLANQHPPDGSDLDRAWHHYIDLTAEHGKTVGWAGGRQAATRLLADSANIVAAFTAILTSDNPSDAFNALGPLAIFARMSGFDATTTLELAITAAGMDADTRTEAEVRVGLAELARMRSNYDRARTHYDQALLLYRQSDDVLGEANCIQGLGDIARVQSDHNDARTHYDQALALYRQIGSVLGEANCIQSLGDIALDQSDHDNARTHYDQALALYRQIDDVLGEANCIQGLGDIARDQSDHNDARTHYDQALALYRQVGDLAGEANCIQSSGDIALDQSDHDNARTHYDQALALYRQIGSVLGEANCIQGLGDIALDQSDHDTAHSHYNDSLKLYERIPEPYSIGQANRRLARLASDEGERRGHVETARAAWAQIHREDLIAELDEEFGAGGSGS